ncbi:hypothetical protein PV396_42245 [Streptomyces sp. ME02-8801-2C]|uniref:hypothetical protein n=1 Tax=Streptomyces sp. ME02-8801-2C TaxID=3028680 RepID=UPI0029B2F29A|nr:hypothetical protein [Streptomyces sp. ME02-8801-2C]MDX3458487.1 hypothetical protein [Streptomyces sp. ME02-8801-2C]
MAVEREIRLNSSLRAEINLPCPEDGSAYREVAEAWFTAALAELAGALGEEFGYDLDLSARASAITGGNSKYGDPGSFWASLLVTRASGRMVETYWSPKNWRTFLRDVEKMPPEAKVQLALVGNDGFPGEPWLDVSVVRERDAPDWIALVVDRTTEEFADTGTRSDAQNRWTAFLGTQAHAHESILFGGVADDAEAATGRTALEATLGLFQDDTFPDLDSVLRGYAWITVCSPGVVRALGGVGRLRDSAAFFAVEPLACGGALLRATENIWEYGPDAVHAVFRALAPALPPGEASPVISSDTLRLAFEDAAELERP